MAIRMYMKVDFLTRILTLTTDGITFLVQMEEDADVQAPEADLSNATQI